MTPDARYPVRHAQITRAGRRGDDRDLTGPPTDEAYYRGCARVLQQLGAWLAQERATLDPWTDRYRAFEDVTVRIHEWLDAVLGARYDE